MIFKILHFWRKDWGDVIIPFVCKECGECCNRLGTGWAPYDIDRATGYLSLEHDEFLKKYLEGKESEEGIKYSRNVKPCPFLTKENSCSIYPERPLACRLYPLRTTLRAAGVDCPGLKEMNRAIESLGQELPYTATNHSLNPKSKLGRKHLADIIWNLPKEAKWTETRDRYLKSIEDESAKKLFLELNTTAREEKIRVNRKKNQIHSRFM